MCRLEDHPITFKDIREQYQQQPQYTESTCDLIYMGEQEPKSEILRFYNKKFLCIIKYLIAIEKGQVNCNFLNRIGSSIIRNEACEAQCISFEQTL